MGTVALALGVLLVLVVIASQTGVLGGHDFLSVAMAGLAFAAFAVVAAVRTEGAERTRALAALGLAFLPVALLGYFFVVSDG